MNLSAIFHRAHRELRAIPLVAKELDAIIQVYRQVARRLRSNASILAELDQIFQPGNIIRRSTGQEYVVTSGSEFSIAFVTCRKTGKPYMVDWLSPSGELRRDIVDNWTLVATRAQLAEILEREFFTAA